jgi:hypothetical protein
VNYTEVYGVCLSRPMFLGRGGKGISRWSAGGAAINTRRRGVLAGGSFSAVAVMQRVKDQAEIAYWNDPQRTKSLHNARGACPGNRHHAPVAGWNELLIFFQSALILFAENRTLCEMMLNQTMNFRNSVAQLGGVARATRRPSAVSSPEVDECGE